MLRIQLLNSREPLSSCGCPSRSAAQTEVMLLPILWILVAADISVATVYYYYYFIYLLLLRAGWLGACSESAQASHNNSRRRLYEFTGSTAAMPVDLTMLMKCCLALNFKTFAPHDQKRINKSGAPLSGDADITRWADNTVGVLGQGRTKEEKVYKRQSPII